VLNSVAIAFVFDLDNIMYNWFCGPRHHRKLAALQYTPSCPTEQLGKADPSRLDLYAGLICVVDLFLMVNFYLLGAFRTTMFPGHLPQDVYEIIRDSVYLRGGTVCLAQLAATLTYLRDYGRAGAIDTPRWWSTQCLRIALNVVLNVGGSLVAFQVCLMLNYYFGHTSSVMASPLAVGENNASICACFQGSTGCERLTLYGDVPSRMQLLGELSVRSVTKAFANGPELVKTAGGSCIEG
jgi:hypothetical protein